MLLFIFQICFPLHPLGLVTFAVKILQFRHKMNNAKFQNKELWYSTMGIRQKMNIAH